MNPLAVRAVESATRHTDPTELVGPTCLPHDRRIDDLMDPDEILELFPPYRDGTTDRRRRMLDDVTPATLPAGTVVFATGARCGSVALVGRGNIRVAKTDAVGHEITLYHVGPGETCLLTLSCALTGDRYQADAATQDEVEAALVPADRFRTWFDDDPLVRDFVMTAITHRVTDLMRLVEDVAFRDLRTRVARFLREEAVRDDRHCIAITHDALAVEVGASRESVSRILKEWERNGLVDLGRGRIRVPDATRLCEDDEWAATRAAHPDADATIPALCDRAH